MLRPAGRAFSDDPPLLHAVVEMMPKIREAVSAAVVKP
jgi:hypothetical protein